MGALLHSTCHLLLRPLPRAAPPLPAGPDASPDAMSALSAPQLCELAFALSTLLPSALGADAAPQPPTTTTAASAHLPPQQPQQQQPTDVHAVAAALDRAAARLAPSMPPQALATLTWSAARLRAGVPPAALLGVLDARVALAERQAALAGSALDEGLRHGDGGGAAAAGLERCDLVEDLGPVHVAKLAWALAACGRRHGGGGGGGEAEVAGGREGWGEELAGRWPALASQLDEAAALHAPDMDMQVRASGLRACRRAPGSRGAVPATCGPRTGVFACRDVAWRGVVHLPSRTLFSHVCLANPCLSFSFLCVVQSLVLTMWALTSLGLPCTQLLGAGCQILMSRLPSTPHPAPQPPPASSAQAGAAAPSHQPHDDAGQLQQHAARVAGPTPQQLAVAALAVSRALSGPRPPVLPGTAPLQLLQRAAAPLAALAPGMGGRTLAVVASSYVRAQVRHGPGLRA